jgi:hypothetical protein
MLLDAVRGWRVSDIYAQVRFEQMMMMNSSLLLEGNFEDGLQKLSEEMLFGRAVTPSQQGLN